MSCHTVTKVTKSVVYTSRVFSKGLHGKVELDLGTCLYDQLQPEAAARRDISKDQLHVHKYCQVNGPWSFSLFWSSLSTH